MYEFAINANFGLDIRFTGHPGNFYSNLYCYSVAVE